MGRELERIKDKLSKVGYKLAETTKHEKINELLLSILRSNDARLMKSIPYLFYKSSPIESPVERYLIDLDAFIKNAAKDKKIKSKAAAIISLTHKVLMEHCVGNIWIQKISSSYNQYNEFYRSKSFSGIISDSSEYAEELLMQKTAEEHGQKSNLPQQITVSKERDIQFARSKLFTRKEKEILDKINNSIVLTRTEYNYYSSKTKKKLESITTLKEYADMMMRMKPKLHA